MKSSNGKICNELRTEPKIKLLLQEYIHICNIYVHILSVRLDPLRYVLYTHTSSTTIVFFAHIHMKEKKTLVGFFFYCSSSSLF